MGHYICTGGCKGESETPGVCLAEGCARHGESLEECNCKDRAHFGAFEVKKEEEDGDYSWMRDRRETR